MDEKLRPAVSALQARFSAEGSEFKDEVTVLIQPEFIVNAVQALKDEFGFDMLVNETAVDYLPQVTPRFHVVYHIYSMKQKVLISLRVPLNGNDPHIHTVEKVHPGANWLEREIYDLMGITFDGHSDLRRIIMPHDWEGYPLRKDYPLGYEEVEFTFNFNEIDVRKPYAKE